MFRHYAVETGGVKKRKDVLAMCGCNEGKEANLRDIIAEIWRDEETGSVIVIASDATDVTLTGNDGRGGSDFLVDSETNGDIASCKGRNKKKAVMFINLECLMIGWSERGDIKLRG